MELNAVALWLNDAFAGFDGAILSALHGAAEGMGGILTPLARLVTLIGEKGILFFALAAVLICFKRTRRLGVCVFGAVCCGALITNIILKDAVARLRPFEASALFRTWWEFIGAPEESGFSFPSGHVTAAAAGMTALCLAHSRRWIAPAAVWVTLMAVSRNYLMAHYPTDVLAAAFVGVLSAGIAWAITRGIYALLARFSACAFCRFVLNFDLSQVVKRSGTANDGEA